ncbi:hypothetical protein GALMADRAFT_255560 [Galerina marginata CBS 339.88]|uniref:Uncharacterized protein n=1 Tax=Galerina marginata (strain CBS 339.88) TaxID=685588 RepID=A0A067SIC9_GALM3|nr:hypothetical protein GALMADRAFT_255560 [Galerina marginata CBS 339.88]
MSASDGIIFMSMGVTENKTFEESRVEDYSKAYQATGRPPQPCPQVPTDELQRGALNLPPLFQPKKIKLSEDSPVQQKVPFVEPNQFPVGQEFRLFTNAGEKYHAICCMPEYEKFCHEELRCYAYMKGNIKSPVPIVMHPFIQPSRDVVPLPGTVEDKLQSQCSEPGYDKHSSEEFHVAFLLHGRELTSAELLAYQPGIPPGAIAPPPPPLAPVATSLPTPIPQPIYSASTSTIPKFTFGLR